MTDKNKKIELENESNTPSMFFLPKGVLDYNEESSVKSEKEQLELDFDKLSLNLNFNEVQKEENGYNNNNNIYTKK
jgi:hypothetical protein